MPEMAYFEIMATPISIAHLIRGIVLGDAMSENGTTCL